jgi:tetratricopeptide (TPR) repeat protein
MLGDRAGHGHALLVLGTTASETGRTGEAREVLGEAAAIFRELGDRWRLTMALNGLGTVLREEEQYAAALVTYDETLEQARAFGEAEGIAVALINLSLVTMRLEQLERARAHLREAIALLRDLGWKRMAVSALDVAGELLTRFDRDPVAVELFASAAELRAETGNPRGPWWAKWRDRDVQELAGRLGAAEFAARWTAGQALTMDAALARAQTSLGGRDRLAHRPRTARACPRVS